MHPKKGMPCLLVKLADRHKAAGRMLKGAAAATSNHLTAISTAVKMAQVRAGLHLCLQ
jgi:hypothetical protein